MIVLLGCLFLNAVLLYTFFKFPKQHLHVLEIFLIWCVSSLLIQNYYALQTMNSHSSIIPDVLTLKLANFLNRTVLYPVATLSILNRYFGAATVGLKLATTISYIVLITAAEWLSGRLSVFVHITWPFWGTAVVWLAIFFVCIGIMHLMRWKLLTKV